MIDLSKSVQLCTLNERTLMRVSGPDSQTFLEGQWTQHFSVEADPQHHWAAICTPKGKVLATCLTWKQNNDYWLSSPASNTPFLMDHLKKFLLRSHCTLTLEQEKTRQWGMLSNDWATIQQDLQWPEIPPIGYWDEWAGGVRIRLDERALFLCLSDNRREHLAPLLSHTSIQSETTWNNHLQLQGVLEIDASNRDQWLPQHINWDLIQGIHFKKGCYTGQEIIARTHYLGSIKRRLLGFWIPEAPPSALSSIYPLNTDTTIGHILSRGEPTELGTLILAIVPHPYKPYQLRLSNGVILGEPINFSYPIPQ
jgi:hypothetical protein